jgi:hypothetical protein
MLTWWARRSEDLSFDKNDEKDAVLIARLTSQLRCYVPEPVDGFQISGVIQDVAESYGCIRNRVAGLSHPAQANPTSRRQPARRGKAGFT